MTVMLRALAVALPPPAPNRRRGPNAVRLVRALKASDASCEQVSPCRVFTPLS